MPPAHLLAETVRDEERVVDRDAETDERHNVQGIDGYVGDARDEEHPGDPADDRKHPHTERHESRDDRSEHDKKEDQRERQRDGLGPTEILLENRVESVVDREKAGSLDAQGVGPHLGTELGVIVASGSEIVLRRHLDRKSTRLNSSHVAISYAVF